MHNPVLHCCTYNCLNVISQTSSDSIPQIIEALFCLYNVEEKSLHVALSTGGEIIRGVPVLEVDQHLEQL